MRVLALYSVKGGVGKTTTAVNLATLSALQGRRTLLFDLDPQGAATWMMEGTLPEGGRASRPPARAAGEALPELLSEVIPASSEIERQTLTRVPVVYSQPRSEAAQAYYRLWRVLHAPLAD